MNIIQNPKTWLQFITLTFVFLLTPNTHAWVAAGHGEYFHGGGYYRGGGYYYHNGWAAPGVVIGVPEGAYYGSGCSLIQRCYPNGGCINQRICE